MMLSNEQKRTLDAIADALQRARFKEGDKLVSDFRAAFAPPVAAEGKLVGDTGWVFSVQGKALTSDQVARVYAIIAEEDPSLDVLTEWMRDNDAGNPGETPEECALRFLAEVGGGLQATTNADVDEANRLRDLYHEARADNARLVTQRDHLRRELESHHGENARLVAERDHLAAAVLRLNALTPIVCTPCFADNIAEGCPLVVEREGLVECANQLLKATDAYGELDACAVDESAWASVYDAREILRRALPSAPVERLFPQAEVTPLQKLRDVVGELLTGGTIGAESAAFDRLSDAYAGTPSGSECGDCQVVREAAHTAERANRLAEAERNTAVAQAREEERGNFRHAVDAFSRAEVRIADLEAELTTLRQQLDTADALNANLRMQAKDFRRDATEELDAGMEANRGLQTKIMRLEEALLRQQPGDAAAVRELLQKLSDALVYVSFMSTDECIHSVTLALSAARRYLRSPAPQAAPGRVWPAEVGAVVEAAVEARRIKDLPLERYMRDLYSSDLDVFRAVDALLTAYPNDSWRTALGGGREGEAVVVRTEGWNVHRQAMVVKDGQCIPFTTRRSEKRAKEDCRDLVRVLNAIGFNATLAPAGEE